MGDDVYPRPELARSTLLVRPALERRNECSLQSTQMSSDVRAEVSAQGRPVTVQQNLEIPSRLRRLDGAECVFLIRL